GADVEGSVPGARAREGVEGRDRAVESGACERDAEARATCEAAAQPAAGAEGDVSADARGARGAARDAGAAGRPRAGGDQPPDAAAAREAEEAPLARSRAEPRRWVRRKRLGRS